MSRRPARFTQAELRRAYAIAKAENAQVEIVEGVIRLIPMPSAVPTPTPVAEKRKIVL
jgi:hypothetical protein